MESSDKKKRKHSSLGDSDEAETAQKKSERKEKKKDKKSKHKNRDEQGKDAASGQLMAEDRSSKDPTEENSLTIADKEKNHKKQKKESQNPEAPAGNQPMEKSSQTTQPAGGYSKNSARKKKKRDKLRQAKLEGGPAAVTASTPNKQSAAHSHHPTKKQKAAAPHAEPASNADKKPKQKSEKPTTPKSEKKEKQPVDRPLPAFLADLSIPSDDSLRQVQRECHQAGIRRDLIAFNKMISQYGQRKQLPLALEVYKQLTKTKLVPTVFTFTNLVNACVRCGEMERACQVLTEMESHSVRPNEVTFTALIKGFCQDGDMQGATEALENMKAHGTKPNLRTYNTILRGALRSGAVPLAQKMFAEMRKSHVAPDVSAFEYLVKTLAQSMRIVDAWKIIDEMKAQKIEHSPAYAALATACALQGDAAGARKALLAAEQHIDKMHALYQHSSEGGDEDGGYGQYDGRTGGSGGYANSFQNSQSYDVGNNSWNSSYHNNSSSYGNEGGGGSGERGGGYGGRERASLPLFLRLRIEELKRECDRVREHLTAAPNGSPPKFGLFPNSSRVVIAPSPSQGTASSDPSKSVPSTPIDIAAMFANANPTRLEVCAGHGDWIVDRAQRDTASNWMALEMRFERVYQIWGKMIFTSLPNLAVICGEAHHTVRQRFSNNSLEEVFINFPDPPVWEGSKQRLIDKHFLEQIHRVLKPEACLTILTDDEGYANQVASEITALASIFKSLFGNKAYINTVPDNYGVNSYFDRMWLNGQRTKRFYFRYQKI